MNNSELTQLHLQVSANDATEEDIDQMTRQLLSELREIDVESARLAKWGDAPCGTKSGGDPVAIGCIVISALPTILPAVVSLVEAWIERGQGRTVKFKGKGIEFEGSPEELQKLLARLERGKRKK